MTLAQLKTLAESKGYRFERIQTAKGIEERMIRPDGTVAIIAKKSDEEVKS